MDFGSANRSAVMGIHILPARADAAATRGAVPVELPASQTVQSVPAGDPVQIDIRQKSSARGQAPQQGGDAPPRDDAIEAGRRQMREVIERRLMIDPHTRSVVMHMRNRETGETVTTVPDEASLKLRQYGRALAVQARQDAEAQRYVERTA